MERLHGGLDAHLDPVSFDVREVVQEQARYGDRAQNVFFGCDVRDDLVERIVFREISFDGAKAYDQVAYAYQYSVMPAENAMVEIAAPLPRSTHLILTDGAKLSISNIGYSMRFDNLVANMWLYYTKQNFSDKRAVSSIYFNSSSSGAVGEIDLNKGAGGAYIYMHYSTVTKTNRPKTDLKIASDFRYDGNNHKLLVEVPTLFEGSNIKYWYTYESETSTRRSLFSSLADFYVSGAGMHTVEYYVEGNSYADQSSTYSQTVIVSKSSNNNLSVNIGSSYMQGEEFFPSLAGKNLSTGSFRYEYSTSGSSAYTSTKPSAPGSYWVRAVIEGDKNCYRYTTRSSGFRINALMAYATIEPIPAQVYTGSAICPEVTVKHGEKILKQDSDYFVSCSNNIDVGTATMIKRTR